MAQIDMGNGKSFNSEFGGVNQADHLQQVADSIAGREKEIYQYQININNFEAMLAGIETSLPAEWPENLLQYRSWDRDRLIATLDDATLETVTGLLFRDNLRMRIRTERIEQKKSQLVLQSLALQVLNPDAVRARIAQDKAKQNTPSV
jgi:hypothetical protein